MNDEKWIEGDNIREYENFSIIMWVRKSRIAFA